MEGIRSWCFVPPKWWTNKPAFSVVVTVFILSLSQVYGDDYRGSETFMTYFDAIVNVSFVSSLDGESESRKFMGKFSPNGKVAPQSGRVFSVRSKNNETHGCSDYDMKIPTEKWIAFIKRGKCLFGDKISRAAKTYNASAVVIYNSQEDKEKPLLIDQKASDVISVSLNKEDGETILNWLEFGFKVHMTISVGQEKTYEKTHIQSNISKTSVLFVSISFIVLMIISLAWLVFYYIQRFRYAHAKERLARRLASAAKKAIAKIPQRSMKSGDKELDSDFDQCAVCIEGYKAHDVIRTLPCKHVFHKSCVDPWLLEQRSCPMCKLDILRAYGMQVGGSEDCVHQDGESAAASVPAEDVEQTSIGEDQGAEGQVKVLLLPHNCVHFHHEGESSVDSQTEDETTGGGDHLSDSEFMETQSLMMESGLDTDCVHRYTESTA